MRNTQYIVVGTADQDRIESGYPALCLLTRRVFKTHEEAQAFIGDPSSGRHRTGRVVECYFPVPDSLYRGEWAPKVLLESIFEREMGKEVCEGRDLPELTELAFSQRDNARNAAAAYKAEAEELRAEVKRRASLESEAVIQAGRDAARADSNAAEASRLRTALRRLRDAASWHYDGASPEVRAAFGSAMNGADKELGDIPPDFEQFVAALAKGGQR